MLAASFQLNVFFFRTKQKQTWMKWALSQLYVFNTLTRTILLANLTEFQNHNFHCVADVSQTNIKYKMKLKLFFLLVFCCWFRNIYRVQATYAMKTMTHQMDLTSHQIINEKSKKAKRMVVRQQITTTAIDQTMWQQQPQHQQ